MSDINDFINVPPAFDTDALILSASSFLGFGIASMSQTATGNLLVIFDNSTEDNLNDQIITVTVHTGNSSDGFSANVLNDNVDRCRIFTKLSTVDPAIATNRFPISIRRTLIPA
jgi:hypothetical protein